MPARDETGSGSVPDTPRLHLDPGVSANAGTKDGTLNPEELSVRYGVEFDMDSVPRIRAEHGSYIRCAAVRAGRLRRHRPERPTLRQSCSQSESERLRTRA